MKHISLKIIVSGKRVTLHAVETYMGNRSLAPLTLALRT